MASEPIWKRLGFTTRNQYRNAKARESINPRTGKPFTSYRQQRDQQARERGRVRDYAAERERANRLSQTRGYPSASKERSVKAELKARGISYDKFNWMRNQNRKHWAQIHGASKNLPNDFPVDYHRYREPSEKSGKFFTGYVISYYHAIVDEKHNWDSVRDDEGLWEMEIATDSAGDKLVPKSDPWWYQWLVVYGQIVSANYYQARYGRRGK